MASSTFCWKRSRRLSVAAKWEQRSGNGVAEIALILSSLKKPKKKCPLDESFSYSLLSAHPRHIFQRQFIKSMTEAHFRNKFRLE